MPDLDTPAEHSDNAAHSPPDDSTHTATERPTRRRRRRGRVIALFAFLVVGAWGIAAARVLHSAYGTATRAKALLTEFREDNGGSFSGIDPLTTTPDLTRAKQASAEFDKVDDLLGSPILAPVRVMPFVGRQVTTVATLSHSSKLLLGSTMAAFDEVTNILEHTKGLPATERAAGRVSAAADLQRTLLTLAGPLKTLETGPREGLMGQVRSARAEFIRNRDELVASLDDAITAVNGVYMFLSGPNTYVVLAANNGEMRAGSGMFLQAGALQVHDGQFTMGDFRATEDMVLDQPAAEFDPALAGVWDGFRPTAEWRNINLTARFDESGRVAAAMWHAMGNEAPQGVLAIDIRAVEQLLEVVGPVSIAQPDGTDVTLDSQNVASYLLLQQYLLTTDSDGSNAKTERRTMLGDVATAIFESFNTGDLGLEKLMDALVGAGRGRHLMAWSSDATQQSAWRVLGLSGELPENAMLFSLINRGGNKLDQFMDVSAQLTVHSTDAKRTVEVRLGIANTTPDGLPTYVVGPHPRSGVAAGDYIGYVALNLPRGAANVLVDGDAPLAVAADGRTRLVLSRVTVPKGTTMALGVTFDLPIPWATIDVLPSARIPAVSWSYRGTDWRDRQPRPIDLD